MDRLHSSCPQLLTCRPSLPTLKPRGASARVALALALAWLQVAAAQTDLSKAEMAFIGRWDIAHADETPDHCALALLKDETIGGHQVRLNRPCGKALAWTGEVTAWRVQPDGTLVLGDAQRHAVIGFRRDEAGDLSGTGPDRSVYVLYPLDTNRTRR